MAITTLNEAIAYLNDSYESLGFAEAGSNVITADNMEERIGAIPSETIGKILNQMYVILEQKFFRNLFDRESDEFKPFIRNLTMKGYGILEVFQEIIDGQTPGWSLETGAEIASALVKRYSDAVKRNYVIDPSENQFACTTDEREYSKYFTPEGLPNFIDNKIANLASSAEYWLMNEVIGELTRMYNAEEIKTVYPNGFLESQGTDDYSFTASEDKKKELVQKVLSTVHGMTTMSRLYNHDEVISKSAKDDLYIVTDVDLMADLRVNIFSSAYNLDQIDIDKKVIYLPAGTDFGSTVKVSNAGGNEFDSKPRLMIFDYRAVVVGVRTWMMTAFPVANTLWTNHFLSVECVKGHNTFINCMAFADAESDEGG